MPRRAAFDRDTALHQAMDLFWARGFHATSLKDIEAALDMRPGSIYAAFGSKEGLFQAALARYAARSKASLQEALEVADGPIEGLALHIRRMAKCLQGDGPSRACMLTKTVLEATPDEAALRDAAEALLRETELEFAAAFRQAQAAGQIDPALDPDRLATRLQVGIMGLRAYAQRSGAGVRAVDLGEDMARELEAMRL